MAAYEASIKHFEKFAAKRNKWKCYLIYQMNSSNTINIYTYYIIGYKTLILAVLLVSSLVLVVLMIVLRIKYIDNKWLLHYDYSTYIFIL